MATETKSCRELKEPIVPGVVDVMGVGFATNTVTVNSQATYRKGESFRKEVTVANNSAPVWQSITVSAAGQTNIAGNVLVPRANESFWHDSDGNLLSDSLWTNTWNPENRLVEVESAVNVPGQARMREEWTHLPDGRWIQRVVSTNSGGVYYPAYTNRFVWDRQVLLAILDHTNGVVASFMRGSDLSGSIQDAGGVGGVLAVNLGRSTLNLQPSTHCVSYDGNGNVVALHNAADGAESAAYEYGPFSEPIRVTGPVASLMPLRFSTMYEDNVTGDRKYLFRDYTPSTGRWKSRDPIEEEGGKALYAFVGNDPVIAWDLLGLDRMSLSQMEALLATSSERFYNQLVALCPKCPVEWTDERGNVQTCDPEVCRLTALVMMVDFSYYLRATFTSQYRRFGNVLAFTSWYDSETINDRADQGPGNGNMSEHYNAGYGLKCTGMQELMMTRFYAVTLPVRDRHSQCFKGALFHRLPVMLRRAAHNWFAIYGPLNNDPKKPDITVDPWYSAGGIISKQGSYGHVDEIKPKLW